MPPASQKHTYRTELSRRGRGSTVIWLPEDVAEALGAKGNLRVEGTVNGVPFRLALHKPKRGGFFLLVGKPFRQQLGSSAAGVVDVEIWVDPRPNQVDLPKELEAALAQEAGIREAFERELTAGRRRSLAHYVNSAKTEETRIKRALEILEHMLSGTIHEWGKRSSSWGI